MTVFNLILSPLFKYNCICFQDPTPVIMEKHWEWKNDHGVLKAIEVEAKGYVVDLFEGLKARVYLNELKKLDILIEV